MRTEKKFKVSGDVAGRKNRWNRVDWRDNDAGIASELGVSREAVRLQRLNRGERRSKYYHKHMADFIENHSHNGVRRGKYSWDKADWSMGNQEIAKQIGCKSVAIVAVHRSLMKKADPIKYMKLVCDCRRKDDLEAEMKILGIAEKALRKSMIAIKAERARRLGGSRVVNTAVRTPVEAVSATVEAVVANAEPVGGEVNSQVIAIVPVEEGKVAA